MFKVILKRFWGLWLSLILVVVSAVAFVALNKDNPNKFSWQPVYYWNYCHPELAEDLLVKQIYTDFYEQLVREQINLKVTKKFVQFISLEYITPYDLSAGKDYFYIQMTNYSRLDDKRYWEREEISRPAPFGQYGISMRIKASQDLKQFADAPFFEPIEQRLFHPSMHPLGKKNVLYLLAKDKPNEHWALEIKKFQTPKLDVNVQAKSVVIGLPKAIITELETTKQISSLVQSFRLNFYRANSPTTQLEVLAYSTQLFKALLLGLEQKEFSLQEFSSLAEEAYFLPNTMMPDSSKGVGIASNPFSLQPYHTGFPKYLNRFTLAFHSTYLWLVFCLAGILVLSSSLAIRQLKTITTDEAQSAYVIILEQLGNLWQWLSYGPEIFYYRIMQHLDLLKTEREERLVQLTKAREKETRQKQILAARAKAKEEKAKAEEAWKKEQAEKKLLLEKERQAKEAQLLREQEEQKLAELENLRLKLGVWQQISFPEVIADFTVIDTPFKARLEKALQEVKEIPPGFGENDLDQVASRVNYFEHLLNIANREQERHLQAKAALLDLVNKLLILREHDPASSLKLSGRPHIRLLEIQQVVKANSLKPREIRQIDYELHKLIEDQRIQV